MGDQPTPQSPTEVQVLRSKATSTGWTEEWVDLSTDVSLNRIDTEVLPGPPAPPTPPAAGLLSNISDPAITENSGWAYSTTTADAVWLTNDEGENPQLRMVRPSTGAVIGSFGISYSMQDPEAVSSHPNGSLWIFDIGDNDDDRHSCSVAVIADPGPGNHGVLTPIKYPIKYDGFRKNAEAALIHPVTGEVFIITKGHSSGRLMKFPDNPSTSGNVCTDTNHQMPAGVSDACFTKDGRYALLRVNWTSSILLFETTNWTHVAMIAAPAQFKGEAITMEPAGLSCLIGSEGSNSPIHRVVLPKYAWPDAGVPQANTALRVRAKIAAETYDAGVASHCRRLVIWYKPDGGSWVRYPESSWSVDGRWWCADSESTFQYFSISMPVGAHYELRVKTENFQVINNTRRLSDSVEGSVWSNRYSTAEQSTAAGLTVADTDPFTVKWKIVDPDVDSAQSAYSIQVRRAGYGSTAPSDTVISTGAVASFMDADSTGSYDIDVPSLPPNVYYEWRVAVKDNSLWSPWSPWRAFFIVGSTQTPLPLSPSGDVSVDVGLPTRFVWDFRDDNDPSDQDLANLRYRTVGAETWTEITGDVTTPGSDEFFDVAAGTFIPGLRYEWQVQTLATSVSGLSDWSTSATFWTVPPSDMSTNEPVYYTAWQGTLGCGTYRAFIYDRGGQVRRGEITPLATIQWDRRRDDISQALLHTNGFGEDCAALLKTLTCWMHELVIYRDGVRVWEGPIVRITENYDGVEIDARDPMVYVYRRILRQGYNDAYPNLRTVVFRATRIIQDALAYDDPNVLGYLTPISNDGDAKESRVVDGWSKSAWEEVDNLAATAGLDYTTVGRRIILWDVHREIGRLPEMKNGDFSDPVVVTEYGMLTANVFAVTNNAGVYGYTQTFISDPGSYGFIEQIASSYGESDAAATEALTPAQLASLQATLKDQAERNISGRYPNPRIVRVPDNTTLSADLEIGINQLVPGVRIPLRSVGALREVTQLQRLDRVTATFTPEEQEKIKVILSPAPTANVESEPEPPPEV